ncbi:MAG: ABC transporter ATP-binding protein [Bacillota bacterium]
MACVLRMQGITKVFGSVVANDNIDFSLEEGEIHALLGENGAGKSTLMNCLYGMYPMTSGNIHIRDKQMHIRSAQDAIANGIGMVHQHFMLMSQLSVTENIILGLKQRREPFLDIRSAEREIQALSDKYGFDIDPRALIKDLPVGLQQRVEILKILYRNANILIFDEATAVLTPQQVEQLFIIIRKLAKEGKSIIMIVHKLEEVMEVCDRVTALRDGKVVGTVAVKDTSPKQLANMMVGRDVVLNIKRSAHEAGEVALSAEDIVVVDKHDKHVVDGISMELRKGEVFGIAGVDGNGQIELSEVVTGMLPYKSGRIRVGGQFIKGRHPKDFIDKKVSHIPQDRQKKGLVMEFTVMEDLVLQEHDAEPYCRRGILDWRKIRSHADELIKEYQIKVSGSEAPANTLSGGNQQKVILAREISRDMNVLVAVQPTRGLDIGATEFVRTKILEQRDKGIAVLLVSTELDEILTLSDRIAVIHKGKFVDVFRNGERTVDQIGLMMAGVSKDKIDEVVPQ